MTISATSQGLRPGVCVSTARPATPFDGMMIYETDTNLVRIWNGAAWKTLAYSDYTSGSVLQTVSTTKTDTFGTTSTSFVDITGLSATITPSSTSSKILIFANLHGGWTADAGYPAVQVNLVRASTSIGQGDAAADRTRAFTVATITGFTDQQYVLSNHYLDSPNTTSATTYKLQLRTPLSAYTAYINRSGADGNSQTAARTSSTITVMEIAG